MAKKKGGPDHGRRLAKHPQRRDSLSGETAFDNLFAHAVALVGSEERARAMLEAALSSPNCRGSQRAREEVEQVRRLPDAGHGVRRRFREWARRPELRCRCV